MDHATREVARPGTLERSKFGAEFFAETGVHLGGAGLTGFEEVPPAGDGEVIRPGRIE